MRLVNFGYVVLPHGVESSSGQDQDRCIDRQREHQCDGAVPSRQPQRLALRGQIKPEGASLHDPRMQV